MLTIIRLKNHSLGLIGSWTDGNLLV